MEKSQRRGGPENHRKYLRKNMQDSKSYKPSYRALEACFSVFGNKNRERIPRVVSFILSLKGQAQSDFMDKLWIVPGNIKVDEAPWIQRELPLISKGLLSQGLFEEWNSIVQEFSKNFDARNAAFKKCIHSFEEGNSSDLSDMPSFFASLSAKYQREFFNGLLSYFKDVSLSEALWIEMKLSKFLVCFKKKEVVQEYKNQLEFFVKSATQRSNTDDSEQSTTTTDDDEVEDAQIPHFTR